MWLAMVNNSFGAASKLRVGDTDYEIFRLPHLEETGAGKVSRLPFSTRILLENLLRHEDGRRVTADDIDYVARGVGGPDRKEISFMPARVLLQDFTGVPAVVDLAAMRDALAAMGADPARANPLLPVDLVIDHSVQVDRFGSPDAFELNAMLEFQRNRERYILLRWGQTAFRNFRVVPPDTGIVPPGEPGVPGLRWSSANRSTGAGRPTRIRVVGTDSHTTMINGLGVLGWGVGGIEAEACMLGQPISMLLPPVVGFKLHGQLPPKAATATDLVLTVTQMLRKKGVVGKFVEFYGPGLSALSAGRPRHRRQHGARVRRHHGLLPGGRRDARLPALHQPRPGADRAGGGLHQGTGPVPHRPDAGPALLTKRWNWILSTVAPSMAGPKRPQDRVALPDVQKNFQARFRLREEDGRDSDGRRSRRTSRTARW